MNPTYQACSDNAPDRVAAHRCACEKNRPQGKWPAEQASIDTCGRRNGPDTAPCAPLLTGFPDVRPTLIPRDSAHRQPVPRSMRRKSSLRNTLLPTTEQDADWSPALWAPYPPPPHRTSDYSPGTYPLAAIHRGTGHRPDPTNKNGVFHVKHAAHFPPTARTIKPSSSPTRGTSRSRADSAQVRPPALPAQTRPSPAHSRSRRSATRPVRSARSAASQRPSRATR